MRKVMFHINSDSATFDNIAVPSGSGSANRLAATYFIGFPSLSAKAHVKKLTLLTQTRFFTRNSRILNDSFPVVDDFFNSRDSCARGREAVRARKPLALWAAIWHFGRQSPLRACGTGRSALAPRGWSVPAAAAARRTWWLRASTDRGPRR
jgi:hypothetical protein